MKKDFGIKKQTFNLNHWRGNDRSKGILLESEVYENLKYVIKEDSLIIISGEHGIFCLDLIACQQMGNEIAEIAALYSQD
ncbi:MAG: hypothetical protein ACRCU3_00315 [Eubacteriaceae bacterium]